MSVSRWQLVTDGDLGLRAHSSGGEAGGRWLLAPPWLWGGAAGRALPQLRAFKGPLGEAVGRSAHLLWALHSSVSCGQ